MKKFFIFTILLVSLSAYSAGVLQDANEVMEKDKAYDFAVNLMRRYSNASNNASIALSPMAAGMIVGVLSSGCESDVHERIADILGIKTSFSDAYSTLMDNLDFWSASNSTPVIASISMWTPNRMRVNLDFQHQFNSSYRGIIGGTFDIRSPNAWISAKTDGIVTNVIDKFNPLSETTIAAAAVFNPVWDGEGFFKTKGTFEGVSGKRKIDMMAKRFEEAKILYRSDYSAISIPSLDGRLSFWLLKPTHGKTVSDVVDSLTKPEVEILHAVFTPYATTNELEKIVIRERNEEILASVNYTETDLLAVIPEFKIRTSDHTMIDILKSFKIPVSGLSYISKTCDVGEIHLTTAVNISSNGEKPAVKTASAPAAFVLNRPFVWVVRDALARTLFIGTYTGEVQPEPEED